ncbi:MAG: hypothetical protein Q4F21_08400 [Lachnospiraceae bacterium]|nr:hypothetical protein [Lachnospiraceae bacterium]
MFRLWGKIIKSNHLLKDMVYCDESDLNRTRKVFQGLEEICNAFDLENPIWLDSTIQEFKRHSKCRFGKDHFIEAPEFDYLEIQVIEED